MKKNMLTVLVLALVVVNIALTAVMMISVMGTNRKTAELVTNIATVMNLELSQPGGEAAGAQQVSLENTDVFNLTGSMTIPLAKEIAEDGTTNSKQDYIVFDVSLSMNKKHEDYKKYGEEIGARESLIKDVITTVVSNHTPTECRDDFDSIKAEILSAVQNLFQSDFIYSVGVSGIKFSN
ncbi:MAG: flagellar basal body-associated FliL family protein [Lachnospiraceae bacterium]|nr:flagellar basal body-associated FliL family protein [Lachnospiraceae bacterium]